MTECGRFRADVGRDGRSVSLGSFGSAEAAALAVARDELSAVLRDARDHGIELERYRDGEEVDAAPVGEETGEAAEVAAATAPAAAEAHAAAAPVPKNRRDIGALISATAAEKRRQRLNGLIAEIRRDARETRARCA